MKDEKGYKPNSYLVYIQDIKYIKLGLGAPWSVHEYMITPSQFFYSSKTTRFFLFGSFSSVSLRSIPNESESLYRWEQEQGSGARSETPVGGSCN